MSHVKLTIKNQNFNSAADVLEFVFDELIMSLTDDMENRDAEGDKSEARALREKIHDIETIRPHTKVVMP